MNKKEITRGKPRISKSYLGIKGHPNERERIVTLKKLGNQVVDFGRTLAILGGAVAVGVKGYKWIRTLDLFKHVQIRRKILKGIPGRSCSFRVGDSKKVIPSLEGSERWIIERSIEDNLILASRSPMSFCVVGEEGNGKTSFIRDTLLEEKHHEDFDRVLYARFDSILHPTTQFCSAVGIDETETLEEAIGSFTSYVKKKGGEKHVFFIAEDLLTRQKKTEEKKIIRALISLQKQNLLSVLFSDVVEPDYDNYHCEKFCTAERFECDGCSSGGHAILLPQYPKDHVLASIKKDLIDQNFDVNDVDEFIFHLEDTNVLPNIRKLKKEIWKFYYSHDSTNVESVCSEDLSVEVEGTSEETIGTYSQLLHNSNIFENEERLFEFIQSFPESEQYVVLDILDSLAFTGEFITKPTFPTHNKIIRLLAKNEIVTKPTRKFGKNTIAFTDRMYANQFIEFSVNERPNENTKCHELWRNFQKQKRQYGDMRMYGPYPWIILIVFVCLMICIPIVLNSKSNRSRN